MYNPSPFLHSIGIKNLSCDIVTSIKFDGKIEIDRNVFMIDVCKACPNLRHLIFNKCENRILINKDITEWLVVCKNLKYLEIIGSDRLSYNVSLKIPILYPSLVKLVIIQCSRMNKNILEKMRKLYPSLKIEGDY